jgi:hypothetical protein
MRLASRIRASHFPGFFALAGWPPTDPADLLEGPAVGQFGPVGINAVFEFGASDDRDGNFLRSWGEGEYPRAHGVHMAPDDTMFLTDDH